MHPSVPASSEVGYLPVMYSFSGPTSLPRFEFGCPSTSDHLQTPQLSKNSWETRCLRKNRRRADDEACSAKRRRLMIEPEVEISESSYSSTHFDWSTANSCPPLCTQQDKSATSQPCPAPKTPTLLQPSSATLRSETENSCMEIEAAQRKLQEIEDRITLEDDEDEDLDVEPTPRRPVLVISDSLKEGLQRGISDILPHTVAQSVSHSCMELVLWRPPDDPFCRKQKSSLQKLLKQQTVSQQPLTPCPSPSPQRPPSPPPDTHASSYSFSVAHSSGEEDMEM